ncbi:MAG: PQQ-binding-like beta-propeller repeat protein [Bdellovibrionales bacterium]
MRDYLKDRWAEISRSPALQIYGAALTVLHLLTTFYWWKKWPIRMADADGAICFPYFSTCHLVHGGTEALYQNVLILYGVFSLLILGFWIAKKWREAWLGLLLITVLKFALMSLDYRFMGNFHYISYWVISAFLFLPHAQKFIPLLLCAIYFSSGLLKINAEWLTGAAISVELPLPPLVNQILLFLTVVLQLVGVWGILFRKPSFFWPAYLGLIAFHAFSFWIVGFFFPAVMFVILLLPLLNRRYPPRGGLKISHSIFLGLYGFFQLIPHLASGDSALTGEGRTFSLNLFDSHTSCQSFAHIRTKGRIAQVSFETETFAARIHCDPLVYFWTIQRICREMKDESDFVNVDWYMLSRRATDHAYSRIVEARDFCTNEHHYSIWPLNSFVIKQSQEEVDRAAMKERVQTRSVPKIANSTKLSPPVTSNYRGDAQRSGRHPWSSHFQNRPREIWRHPIGNVGIHGASKASPAVDNTGVYVGSDSGWFSAFDLKGNLRWQFFASDADQGIHGTASLDDEAVYFGAYNGFIYKLDKEDGHLIWTNPLGNSIGASPFLTQDDLYISVETFDPNGFLAKLNRATGELRWVTKDLGNHSHSSPAFSIDQGSVIIGDNTSRLRSFSTLNGALQWEVEAKGEIKSTPTVDRNDLYFTSWDKGLYKIKADTGLVLWRFEMDEKSQSSPTVWPEHNLVVAATNSGTVFGVNLKTGRLKWKIPGSGQPNKSSALLLADGRDGLFLIACGKNHLCAINYQGEVLYQIPLKGSLTGVPVVHGKRLYLSENDPGFLMAFEW